MNVVFGAIADDFTGATDLAAMLARAGVRVNLRIGIPMHGDDTAAFEVIALKSRTEPVEDAVAQARGALAWLRAVGAQHVFWKYCSTFDSTSRGNIGPVAEALMADLGISQTIYCPAFPENGRTVYNGYLHVGDQLLSESPMKDHPLTPMRDSHLGRLLTPQVQRDVGQIIWPTIRAGTDAVRARLADLKAAAVPHVIVDAIDNSDLAIIAEATQEMTLLTGGSAIAQSLPGLYRASGLLPKSQDTYEMPAISGGQIVLSGSCSAMTREQVGHYLKQAAGYRLDPLDLAERGAVDARAWLAGRDPMEPKIIYATAEPSSVQAAQDKLGVARAGVLVEDALSQLALDAVAHGITQIVVAGGETSGAVTRALDVDSLAIGREIAPGVPWTTCDVEGTPVALALKSGNFGAPSFFADALSMLAPA